DHQLPSRGLELAFRLGAGFSFEEESAFFHRVDIVATGESRDGFRPTEIVDRSGDLEDAVSGASHEEASVDTEGNVGLALLADAEELDDVGEKMAAPERVAFRDEIDDVSAAGSGEVRQAHDHAMAERAGEVGIGEKGVDA